MRTRALSTLVATPPLARETTIDVAQCIDARPVSAYQWSVFAICMAIALLDGLDVQTIGVAAPALARDWGVRPEALALVFTAAPAGMLVGALVMGRVADDLGRRRPILAATALFALCTALTAVAPTLELMALIRFATGLGLGGVLPNLISLVTEFAPGRLRGRLTTLTFSSLPFGAMIATLLAQWLIPAYGWRSLFYVGGALPLVVLAVAYFRLPESIRFLTLKAGTQAEALATLRRIAPDALSAALDRTGAAAVRLTVPEVAGRPVAFARLLEPGRRQITLTLIVVTAFNMFMLYFALNWLPTLLLRAGLSTERALLANVLVNVSGGIGAMTWGLLIDRFGGMSTMALAGLAAGVGVALLGIGHDSPGLLIPALVLAGACINGALPGLYVVIASAYPTTMRSTGVGSVLGVARIGSVLGPAVGGLLLARSWSIAAIFLFVASLGLLWAVGLSLLHRQTRS